MAAKHARKLFYSWRLEEARYGELFSEGSFDLRHQLDRQHGVSAEFKKVVVDTDRADSQNAFPELHKLRFDLIARRRGRIGNGRADFGDRECGAIDLAIRIEWELRQRNKKARHHVLRKLLLQEMAQLVGWQTVAGFRHEVGDQTFACRRIGVDGDDAVANCKMTGQDCFDFCWFDAKTADFHLGVEPAQKFQITFRKPPDQIARPVKPRVGLAGERVGDEFFGGEVESLEVAEREAIAAHV